MVSVLFLAVLSSCQTPTKQVDYACRATRLETVLAALGTMMNEHLTCSPELRDEPVFIQVHDVAPDQLLQRIAFVLRADWRTSADGATLERNAERNRENELADEETIKSKTIGDFDNAYPTVDAPLDQGAFDQAALELSLIKTVGGDDADQIRTGWHKIDPLIRSIPQLYQSVDWALVRRAWGGQAVFSSDPKAYESRIPAATVANALKEIKGETSAFLAACERRGVRPSDDPVTQNWENANRILAGDAKITIVVSPSTAASRVMIESADGKLWYTTDTGSKHGNLLPSREQLGFDLNEVPDTEYYSERTRKLAELADGAPKDYRTSVDPDLERALLDPLTTDPHAFGDSDFAIALTDHLQANTVIAFSDAAKESSPYLDPSYSLLRSATVRFVSLNEVSFDGRWLTARPTTLTEQQYVHLNRRALAGLLRGIEQTGHLDLALFSEAMPPSPSFFHPLLQCYLKASSQYWTVDAQMNQDTWQFGALFRALTPAQRSRMSHQGLPVSQLTGHALDVYKSQIWGTVENEVGDDPRNPRPQIGWLRALLPPPADLTITLSASTISSSTRVFIDNAVYIVYNNEQLNELAQSLPKPEIKKLQAFRSTFIGLPSHIELSGLIKFTFNSRNFPQPGQISFAFPTDDFKSPLKPFRID